MKIVPLRRAFFARFFESETAVAHDLKATFFWLLSFLAAPGFLLPILIAFAWSPGSDPRDWASSANWGWSLVARRLGVEALREMSLADKTTYLGFVIAATGGVAAMVWSSLLPDRRDALILGALPVRPRTVVFARLLALTSYVGIVAVGMNLLSSVSFGILLAAENTWTFAMRGIAAHFVATVAASLFVFLGIVAVQGLVLVVGGTRVFARVSPVLQLVLVGLVAADLLTLSAVSHAAGDTVRGTATGETWILATPALWFLGLYEWMLGTDNATLVQLGAGAAVAVFGSGLAVVATYPLAYRRLTIASVEHGEAGYARQRRGFAATVASMASRDQRVRAQVEFLLSTVLRLDRHRFVMAASLGITIAWCAVGVAAMPEWPPSSPRIDLLSFPFAAMVFLLTGLRIAASMPAALPSAWLFDAAGQSPQLGRVALERTMAIAVAAPVVILSALFVGWRWGAAAALAHSAMLLAVSYGVVQSVVWRFTGVPCTQPWTPERANLRARWPAYFLIFIALTSGMAAVDWTFVMAIVDPGAMPLAENAVSIALPLTVLAVVGVGRLVRAAALSAETSGDASDLQVLTEAIRAGAGRRPDPDDGRRVPRDGSDGADVVTPRSVLLGSTRGSENERERWFDDLDVRPSEVWRDLRFGVRRLLRAPAFSAFAIVTLALGIGVTAAVASVVVAVVSRPSSIQDPNAVVTIRSRGSTSGRSLSWPDFLDLRTQQTTFVSVEGQEEFPASVSTSTGAVLVSGVLVTGGYFEMLGVRASVGRTILSEDDRADAPPRALLSEFLWRTRFARDPAIVGRDVRIGGAAYEVIGVLPASFRGLRAGAAQPDVWVAMSHPPLTDAALTAYRNPASRSRGYLTALARLRIPGSVGAALAEVSAIGARLDRDAPLGPSRAWRLEPATENRWASSGQVLGAILVLLPVLVLLIACSNLANLVLSKAARRRRELAVRRALGASRWSLVRGQLIEHALLATVGAAGGLAFAQVLVTYIVAYVERAGGFAPEYRIDARLDVTSVAVAAGAVMLAVIVAGLVPAVRLTGDRPGRALGQDGAAMSSRWRGRQRLLSTQVAASLALLLVAALCLRQSLALDREARRHTGLAPVAAVSVAMSLRAHDHIAVNDVAERILAEARQAGGLGAVAVATGLTGAGAMGVETTASAFEPIGLQENRASLTAASPEMFSVLGLQVLSGRTFAAAHEKDAAVISESQSRALFGTANGAGREFVMRVGAETRIMRVLGVVSDAGQDPRTGAPFRDVYVPFDQRPAADLHFTVPPMLILARPPAGDVARTVARLRSAVARADPDLAVRFAGSATALWGSAVLIFGLVVQSTTALAILALGLSMSGLYGVLSQLVASRTRELGIRVALGADRWSIVRLVLMDGARPVLGGLVIGTIVAAIARMALQPFFRAAASAIDPIAIVMAVVPLIAAAAVACYLPARRATRVDPSVTLRDL